MIDWFLSGGMIMWPLLVIALGVVTLAGRTALVLWRDRTAAPAPERSEPRPAGGTLRAILFWGVMAVLVGALGTVVGLVVMARAISAAGGAASALVWSGVALALVSLIAGILVFLLAAGLWLGLDAWSRRVARRASGLLLAPLLLVPLLAGCGDAGGPEVVVADSAGIAIVDNRGPDRPFPAVPRRVATLEPPDSALGAVPWAVAADARRGRIYVADQDVARVLVFDDRGTYLATYGRPGGGPGEFRLPVAATLESSGALVVWDAGRGILSRWSPAGDLLNEERVPVRYWGPGLASLDDRLITVTQTTAGAERRQSLVEVGDGASVEIFRLAHELVPMDLPGINMPAPRIFAPSILWTTTGDTVRVLNGPGYRIDAYVDGRLVASIRRALAPLAVTGAMAARRVEAGPYAGFMRRAGLTAEQIVAAVGHEPLASPVEWLTADPSGRLWVARGNGAAPTPDRADVLDPEGRYLGTIEAPGFPVAFLSDSTFVALEITDLRQTTLGLYHLRRDQHPAP